MAPSPPWALEQGVPCPVNRALTAIIKAMEAQARSLLPEKMFQS